MNDTLTDAERTRAMWAGVAAAERHTAILAAGGADERLNRLYGRVLGLDFRGDLAASEAYRDYWYQVAQSAYETWTDAATACVDGDTERADALCEQLNEELREYLNA